MLEMPFNIRSGKQMQEFLYDFLKLDPLKEKNDKGNYSVNEETIQYYAEQHNIEFCKLLLNYRKLFKSKNTYLAGIKRNLSDDSRIHPNFWLNTVETFRSSSSNINFQNVAKHGDIIEGIQQKLIRGLFTCLPPDKYGEWFIGEVDYVGAEVKIAAMVTDDEQLIYDLNNDIDQHSHWAGVIFGINKPLPEIKKFHSEERFLAKNNFTFANLFGASYKSIAENFRQFEFYKNYVLSFYEAEKNKTPWETYFIEFSERHLKECQEEFYKRYPKVKEWQDRLVFDYYKTGYVETPLGFRRRYPLKRNEIINFPIQSVSFHLLLHSLIQIERRLKEGGFKSHCAGQIHDSGYFNILKKEAVEVMKIVEYEMTHKPWDFTKEVRLEAEWELSNTSWLNLVLDGKPIKAIHKKTGKVFKEDLLHNFSDDFGFDPQLVLDVLQKKTNKETGKPTKIKGWEIEYV